jgi:hypothetical protein
MACSAVLTNCNSTNIRSPCALILEVSPLILAVLSQSTEKLMSKEYIKNKELKI